MNSKFVNPVVLSIFGLLLVGSAHAQGTKVSTNPGQVGGVTIYGHEGAALVLTVYGEKRALLDRQAIVKLIEKGTHNVLWQTTADGSVATFVELRPGGYDIEVSAVEFLTESLRAVNKSGVAILLVEQDVMNALELADRAYVIDHGRVVKSAPAVGLINDPAIREVYMGLS